jgi:hypothetical protein
MSRRSFHNARFRLMSSNRSAGSPRRVQETWKARKDIEQAAELIRVLAEDHPDELEQAFVEARDRGPSWREHLDKGHAACLRTLQAC